MKNYILNKRSREIHDLSRESRQCGLLSLADHNRKPIGKWRMKWLIWTKRANGCVHCMPEYDTDLKNKL